jgi:glycosyltransferase involved in cell wall biosynthesis
LRRLEKIHFSLVLLTRLIARKNTYDLVIVQQALYPAVVAALASWLTERPLVVRVASTGVTSDFANWGALTDPVLRLFRHETRALIVLNRQGANEARSEGFSPDRIHTIPNGIEPGLAPPARPHSRPPRVAYVGAFRSEKRVDLILRAWSLAGAPGELLLAGDGSLRASLEALARQLRIVPVFLGNVADPRRLLRDADIFVLASDAEGMSNALLEGMAEGCACLATFVGGNVDCLAPEVETPPEPGSIVKGSAGWLVGCGDVQAMTSALKMLCGDPGLRETLGRSAREKLLAGHSLERTANEYVKVFKSLL